MDKQALIDKAVEQLKGKWCNNRHNILITPSEKNIVHEPLLGVFQYATCDKLSDCWTVVCDKEDFEQRAKELGWVNGFEWGKEYPTNGNKPDLDGDVLVEVKVKRGGWGRAIASKFIEIDLSEYSAVAFRIVDERFKPKQPESHSKPSIDNSWHEKGELPPVGVECEWLSYNTGVWHITKVKAYDDEGQAWLEDEGIVSVIDFGVKRFRPIKSEREKFVEAALSAAKKHKAECDITFAEAMFKEGCRFTGEQ